MAVGEWSEQRRVQSTLTQDSDAPSIQYLAGYFDGEGCFSAQIPKEDEPIQFIVTISTTNGEEVLNFKRRFGGSVSDYDRGKENHSHVWKWYVTGLKARTVAEQLYPHLRGKKEQCGVFIDALSFKRRHLSNGGGGYSDAVIEQMHEYGERIRSFNSAQRRFAEEES